MESREVNRAVSAWWAALLEAVGGKHEAAGAAVRKLALERYGWTDYDKPNGNTFGQWLKYGRFPKEIELRRAAVHAMTSLIALAPAEIRPEWSTPRTMYEAWKSAKEGPIANSAKKAAPERVAALNKALVDDPNFTVREATSPQGLRRWFLQGSWVTDNQTPPYVPRSANHADDTLHRWLTLASQPHSDGRCRGGLVVVAGPPKAGKTRTLLEALRCTRPDAKLWRVKTDPGTLEVVLKSVIENGGRPADHDPGEVVILLDDLQRYEFATTDAITDKLLTRLLKTGVTIAATVHTEFLTQMSAFQYDRQRGRDDLSLRIGASAELVSMLTAPDTLITLNPVLTADELNHIDPELINHAAGHDITQDRFARLPELLAAVDALKARAEEGINDAKHPERAAIIQAAIDATYLYPGGATPDELEQLTGWAHQHHWPTRPHDTGAFDKAIDWATDPIGGKGSTHAIILPAAGNKLALLDPLLPHLQTTPWTPEHLKPHSDYLAPRLLFGIGGYLYSTNNFAEAERWWRQAAAAGYADAMYSLGVLRHEAGDWAGAEDWWRQAVAAGRADAMFNLGVLLEKAGDRAGAEDWYRQAAAAGHADAMSNLGVLLKEAGDRAGAEDWYRQAVAAGHADAMSNLGVLRHEAGDWAGAEDWYRQAVAAGHAGAMFNLGVLRHEAGDWAGAEDWYRQAVAAGHAGAMFNLGVLRHEAGDWAGAEDWYRQAAAAGHAGAMSNLGVLRHEAGDWAGAEDWWRQAVAAGRADAMFNLGVLLKKAGDRAGAEDWYRQAAAAGHAGAMSDLGVLRHEAGDLAGAEDWWRQAAAAGHAGAMFNLGFLRHEAGDLAGAEDWYTRAAEGNDIESMRALADLLEQAERYDEAQVWRDRLRKLEG